MSSPNPIFKIIEELDELRNKLRFWLQSSYPLANKDKEDLLERIAYLVEKLEDLGVEDHSAKVDLDEWKKDD